MFNFEGKYGNIHVDGMSKDIEKLSAKDLEEYLISLEGKRGKLIEEQNVFISQIID